MAMKKSRMMKVYGQSGYRYKATPTIMLKGRWLKDLGFDIGDYISVSCENGKLKRSDYGLDQQPRWGCVCCGSDLQHADGLSIRCDSQD